MAHTENGALPIGLVLITTAPGERPMERWVVETAIRDARGVRQVQLRDLVNGTLYPLMTEAQVHEGLAAVRATGVTIEVMEAAAQPSAFVGRNRAADATGRFRLPRGGSGAGASRNRISTNGPILNSFGR